MTKHSRRLRPLLAAAAVAFCSLAYPFSPLPARLDGSMMPYDFDRCTPAAVPDSLHPFFINYVGRHGARFLSSEKKVEKVEKALAEARSRGTITPLGEKMMRLVAEVRRNTGSRWGALDSVGASEQQRLAAQMSEMWPSVTGAGDVEAIATYVPRVVMSMYEFCHSLGALNPDLRIYTGEGHQYDPLLRYFTVNPLYVTYLSDKPWREQYDSFVAGNISGRPARALVGDIYDDGRLRALTLDIYAVLQSLRAAGLPAPTTEWMTGEEYRACWEAANLEHYYARTVSPLSSEPAIAAIPLLADIISTGDAAVEALGQGESRVSANLRFGHAETLMPLMALLDVEGCCAPEASPDEVAELWRDYDVVPLGANFEIVYLRSDSGNVYALTRLNGRDVTAGGFDTPIVPWDTLRDCWLQRATLLRDR